MYYINCKPEDLPGVKKKSFCINFGGGEIWCEHLDGMYDHTNLVLEKFQVDSQKFKRPSSTSVMAINLDETLVTDDIINTIADSLTDGKKYFTRVAFVGLSKKDAKRMSKAIKTNQYHFALQFINDFEQAKEWLISEKYEL